MVGELQLVFVASRSASQGQGLVCNLDYRLFWTVIAQCHVSVTCATIYSSVSRGFFPVINRSEESPAADGSGDRASRDVIFATALGP